MAQEGLLLTGAIAAIAGIGVLRLSWGRDHRSATLNTAGWALLGGGTVAGWLAAGAWGATVVSLWAMGAALVCLAAAAWISPPARRAASKRRAGVLPEGDEPLGLGRRAATFLLVAGAGLVSSIALGIAAHLLALAMGASEADANVIALFTVPVAWTILAFAVLMSTTRKRQVAILVAPLIAALPSIASGSLL